MKDRSRLAVIKKHQDDRQARKRNQAEECNVKENNQNRFQRRMKIMTEFIHIILQYAVCYIASL
ncbi:MAG: hypothetical protein IJJ86_05010 [Clostridia bacterium]|nr:hypothetical protein [Clostridia bacterium]